MHDALPIRPLVAFVALVLVVAAVLERISVAGAIALLVFGTVTLVLAERLLTALDHGDTVGFESTWGGLGGGLGGWRMSRALGYLIAVSVSGLLLAAVAAAEMAGLDTDAASDPAASPADAGTEVSSAAGGR